MPTTIVDPVVLEIARGIPIQFYPSGTSIVPNDYNTQPIDSEPYLTQLLPWQTGQFYAQKWQYSDVIHLQFNANTSNIAGIVLLDCTKTKVIKTWLVSSPIAYPNNTVTKNGVTVAVNTYDTTLSFASIPAIPEGIYYLRITTSYTLASGTVTEERTSEPLSIAALHYNTRLFGYRNDLSAQNIIFPATISAERQTFYFRVECDICDYQPLSSDTQFEDQEDNPDLLYSNPYSRYLLVIGINNRPPDWVIRKINCIMSCRYVTIDGVGYTKDIGAQFTMNRIPRYANSMVTLPVRPSNNNDGTYTFKLLPKLQSPLDPASPLTPPQRPFIMENIVLFFDGEQQQQDYIIVAENITINPSDDLNMFVYLLNGTINRDLGIRGRWSTDGIVLNYENAEDEVFNELVIDGDISSS